jgi:hypothetical protein
MPAQAELKASPPRVDKRAILSAHPFFKGLGSELIDQVGSHAITRVVKAGSVIYAKGDPGDSLFAVITGTVQISVPSVEGLWRLCDERGRCDCRVVRRWRVAPLNPQRLRVIDHRFGRIASTYAT